MEIKVSLNKLLYVYVLSVEILFQEKKKESSNVIGHSSHKSQSRSRHGQYGHFPICATTPGIKVTTAFKYLGVKTSKLDGFSII